MVLRFSGVRIQDDLCNDRADDSELLTVIYNQDRDVTKWYSRMNTMVYAVQYVDFRLYSLYIPSIMGIPWDMVRNMIRIYHTYIYIIWYYITSLMWDVICWFVQTWVRPSCVCNIWIDVKLLSVSFFCPLPFLITQGAQVWLWFLCQRRRPEVTVISKGDVPLTYLQWFDRLWQEAKPRTSPNTFMNFPLISLLFGSWSSNLHVTGLSSWRIFSKIHSCLVWFPWWLRHGAMDPREEPFLGWMSTDLISEVTILKFV